MPTEIYGTQAWFVKDQEYTKLGAVKAYLPRDQAYQDENWRGAAWVWKKRWLMQWIKRFLNYWDTCSVWLKNVWLEECTSWMWRKEVGETGLLKIWCMESKRRALQGRWKWGQHRGSAWIKSSEEVLWVVWIPAWMYMVWPGYFWRKKMKKKTRRLSTAQPTMSHLKPLDCLSAIACVF